MPSSTTISAGPSAVPHQFLERVGRQRLRVRPPRPDARRRASACRAPGGRPSRSECAARARARRARPRAAPRRARGSSRETRRAFKRFGHGMDAVNQRHDAVLGPQVSAVTTRSVSVRDDCAHARRTTAPARRRCPRPSAAPRSMAGTARSSSGPGVGRRERDANRMKQRPALEARRSRARAPPRRGTTRGRAARRRRSPRRTPRPPARRPARRRPAPPPRSASHVEDERHALGNLLQPIDRPHRHRQQRLDDTPATRRSSRVT